MIEEEIPLPQDGEVSEAFEAQMYFLLDLPETRLKAFEEYEVETSVKEEEEEEAVVEIQPPLDLQEEDGKDQMEKKTTISKELESSKNLKEKSLKKKSTQEVRNPIKEKKTALDSIFISAAPQVRNLQKEAAVLKPVALMKKQKK